MATATYFKFGRHIAYTEYYLLAQTRSQWVKIRSRGYILKLWIAVNNSETAKLRASYLACRQIVRSRQ